MELATILSTTHDRNGSLIKHLESISNQEVDFKYEILVLDDYYKSTKETVDIVNSYKHTKYIHTGKTKKGIDHWRVPGFAYNIGAKLSKGSILTITGCDIELTDVNTYKYVVDTTNNANCLTTINSITYYTEGDKLINENSIRMPYFMTLKKQWFMDIRGYDEDFTGVAGEDNDLMDRLMATYRLVRSPYRIIHHGHEKVDFISPEGKKRHEHNVKLWKERKGILLRNVGREWGKL